MSWLKLDDGFDYHPKIHGLSDRAFRLHIRALLYCSRSLSDGFVPSSLCGELVNRPRRQVEELVTAGLWTIVDDGYSIHDYLDYNPEKAAVMRERELTRQRVQRHRNAIVTPLRNGNVTVPPSRPVPSPAPPQVRTPLSPSETSPQGDGFVDFWTIYPLKVGKAKALQSWLKIAPDETLKASILQAVVIQKSWCPTCGAGLHSGREALPHATTWLNQRRWEDQEPTNRRESDMPNHETVLGWLKNGTE